MKWHKTILVAIVVILFAMLTSCRVQYAEKPSEAGSVPAPQPVAIVDADSGTGSVFDAGKDTDTAKFVAGESGSLDDSTFITGKSNIIEMFKKKYKDMDSPRIAIYLNKELSDEILEWRRINITAHVDYNVEKSNFMDTKKIVGSEDAQIELKARNKLYANRKNPPEAWMWNFEDEFITPFVRNGVKLVDRALMLRLEAAKAVETADTSRRTVEVDALKDKADIIIEILIKSVPRSALGVQFKATAKSVKDASIVAVANSFNWEERLTKKRKKKKFVASADGGYKEDTSNDDFPTVSEMSRYLALDMMDALVENWKNVD